MLLAHKSLCLKRDHLFLKRRGRRKSAVSFSLVRTAIAITHHPSSKYMLLYFVPTEEQSNLLRLVLMIYIIHTRDIYTAYQNRSEHKEVKKKIKDDCLML